MRLALEGRSGAQEAIERLLQQIIRLFAVAGHSGEIRPQPPSIPIVEPAKRFLVHHEFRGSIRQGIAAAEIGECSVTKHVKERFVIRV